MAVLEGRKWSPVAEQLIRSAGYDPYDGVVVMGGAHAEEFRELLDAMYYIGSRKTDEYGDSRMAVESVEFDTAMLYSDLHRKQLRIGQLMKNIKHLVFRTLRIDPHDASPRLLAETFCDLGVYSVRGIQILQRLREKGLVGE